MKISIILIILTFMLLACGGGNNNNNINETKTVLEGTWVAPCKALNETDPNTLYDKHTNIFSKNRFKAIYTIFTDSGCTIISKSNPTIISGTFSIGKEVITTGGLKANEIDSHSELINDKPNDNYNYTIFNINQNRLYLGKTINEKDASTSTLRHDTLDLTNFHEQQ